MLPSAAAKLVVSLSDGRAMLFRQTLLYLPAQLFGPLFQFIAAIVWTHQLDAASYGIVTFLTAAQELIALLVISGWSAYFLRYRDDLAERFGPELRRRDLAVIGTASTLEVVASVPILMSINVPLEPSLVAMTALFLVTRTALGHYAEVCRAEAAIATYTIGQMASPVVGCTLSFWAIAEFGSDPRAVLASLTVAQVGGLIVVLRRLGVHGSPIAPDRQLIRSAFGYAGPLLAAGGALWIGNNGIRLVVDHFAGAVELGLLSVGWGLGQRIASVVAMLVTAAAFPLAVRRLKDGDRAEALNQVAANNLMIFGLLAPMAVGAVMISTPLVTLVIAETFRAATIVIFPIAVVTGAIRNFAIHGACQTFLLVSRPDITLKVNLVDVALTIVACAIGLSIGGTAGAAAGCMMESAIWLTVCFGVAMRQGLPLPIAGLLRILAAAMLMGAVLAIVKLPGSVIGLGLMIALGGGVYGLAIIALFSQIRARALTLLTR